MIIDVPSGQTKFRARVYVNPSALSAIRVAGNNYYWTGISWRLQAGKKIRIVAAAKKTAPGEDQPPPYDTSVAMDTEEPIGNWRGETTCADVPTFTGPDQVATDADPDAALELTIRAFGGTPAVVDVALTFASS